MIKKSETFPIFSTKGSAEINNYSIKFFHSLLPRPLLIAASISYAVFSVFYIDYFSGSNAGLLVSFVLFVAGCFLALLNSGYAIISILLLFFTVPWFPRDILGNYYELQVSKEVQFNTIASLSLFGVPMLYFVSYFIAGVIFLKKISIRAVSYRNLIVVLFLLFLLSLNSQIFYATEYEFDSSRTIEWAQNLMFIPVGYVYYYYFVLKFGIERTIKIFCSLFIILTFILAFRVPLFLLNDIYRGQFSLDLSIYPHLSMAVILGLVVMASCMRKAIDTLKTFVIIGLLAFSILSPSRGFYVILLLSMGCVLLVSQRKLRVLKLLSMLLFLLTIPLIFVLSLSPELFEFFVWKAEILTSGDASDSGRLRGYEFSNILYQSLESPLYFLFGEGPSGYFTFSHEKLPREIYEILSLDSYSEAELSADKFVNPHFFVNVLLLKFGIVGLAAYVFFITLHMIRIAKLIRKFRWTITPVEHFYLIINFVLCIALYFEMFWRPYYLLLFVINFFLIGAVYKKGTARES